VRAGDAEAAKAAIWLIAVAPPSKHGRRTKKRGALGAPSSDLLWPDHLLRDGWKLGTGGATTTVARARVAL